MIEYALIIVDGSLYEQFMTVTIGGSNIELNCKEIRRFIRRANDVGIDVALGRIRPEGREVIRLVYEEFKDDV